MPTSTEIALSGATPSFSDSISVSDTNVTISGATAYGIKAFELGSQGGVEEFARFAVRPNDSSVVGRLGDIAARAAGHEDFDAGLAVLFQE